MSRLPPYLTFAAPDRRLLVFGFLMAFFSSFGQTFFISLFSGQIRGEFGLSHGAFGLIFSAATLISGLSLIWLGRLIDRFDLRVFTAAVCIGLIGACAFMSVAAGPVLLGLAIFSLRISGQGLMGHTAMTSMARYFEADRGKALSIANLGVHAGRGLFPVFIVALVAALGWRGVWLASAAALGVGLVPLMLWLLKGHGARHARLLAMAAGRPAGAEEGTGRQWTLGEVLRDPRFYLILPLALALASIGTGIVFHTVHLTATKGWDLTWYAGSFVGLAASSVIFSLLVGPMVDRLGAHRLVPFYALPAGLAMIVLAAFDAPLTAFAFMILLGASEGASRSIMGAFWAERYGVMHLGAIRAMVGALAIMGTSLSPFLMGWLFDRGVGFAAILYFCAAYLAGAIGLAVISLYANPDSR